MKQGRLIVISGPSGVGKGTIREKIKFDDYVFSISSTTREIRDGEVDGIHYNYITKNEFLNKVNNDEMLEHAEFVGNFYGTEKKEVLKLLNAGKNVLLEIECQGALQVLTKMPNVLSIFIIPPSLEELENRLRLRATEDEEKISKRLKKASEEMKLQSKYQYIVVNEDLDEAVDQLDKILNKEINGI